MTGSLTIHISCVQGLCELIGNISINIIYFNPRTCYTLLPGAGAALTKCVRLSRARAISVKEAPHRTPGKPDPAWFSSCLRWSCVDIYSVYNIYIYSIHSIYSIYSIYSSRVLQYLFIER